MEFAITALMFFIGADDSWLPRGARSFLLALPPNERGTR